MPAQLLVVPCQSSPGSGLHCRCDDRIECLGISGVPPLAPGRCCHYACLQSWELNASVEREGKKRRMFRLLCGVLSSLKCMRYHGCVVFTTAGGKHRVTEERRWNSAHSKMSKIHILGLSVFTAHKQRREESSFQFKWKTSRECVPSYQHLNFFFF